MKLKAEDNSRFLARVLDALKETETSGLLNDRGLTGISGLKTVGALQRLAGLFAGDTTAAYVEIGVFQGLTLVSTALEAPGMPCVGIDNFSTLDPENKNFNMVRERINSFGTANATLINMDFEEALLALGEHLGNRKAGLYFVDGPHDYRSQLVCLLLAKPYLHENAVIVIDDANYPDVRYSTRDFLLSHPEFKMIFEAYTPAHPANMKTEELAKWEAGWLNGVNILVRDPAGLLPDMLPPVDGDRTLYFNEWLAHRLRLAELAPEALALADAVCTGDPQDEERPRAALLDRHGQMKGAFKGRFPDRNVFSSGLTEGRFNTL